MGVSVKILVLRKSTLMVFQQFFILYKLQNKQFFYELYPFSELKIDKNVTYTPLPLDPSYGKVKCLRQDALSEASSRLSCRHHRNCGNSFTGQFDFQLLHRHRLQEEQSTTTLLSIGGGPLCKVNQVNHSSVQPWYVPSSAPLKTGSVVSLSIQKLLQRFI